MSTEKFITYDINEKKAENKKKLKPFKHLKSQIDAEVVRNTPIHLLDEERLPESKTHFQRIKEKHSSNLELVAAADEIILKIDNILNISRARFSSELMDASNEDYSPYNKAA